MNYAGQEMLRTVWGGPRFHTPAAIWTKAGGTSTVSNVQEGMLGYVERTWEIERTLSGESVSRCVVWEGEGEGEEGREGVSE